MSLLAAPPDILRWSPRSVGHGDCAVAALELACGVTYENALAAALTVDSAVLSRGLTNQEIIRSAALLGWKGKVHRHFDLIEDTGILCVYQPRVKNSAHVVYLWEGRIIEPKSDRCQLWLSAPQFLAHYHYNATRLIVFKEEREAK